LYDKVKKIQDVWTAKLLWVKSIIDDKGLMHQS
jgi:hypothetical protein